jgi:trimethylamine:corrinoid methyltransferase-like protein
MGAEVELLLRLGQAERLGGRLARRDLRGQPQLPREGVDLALIKPRDRLDIGEPVSALDEEALVVLEEIGVPMTA